MQKIKEFTLLLAPILPLWLGASPEVESFRGGVTIQQQGKEMVVHASDGAIIDYRSFDVHVDEAVWFQMEDASHRVLNRIHSDRPSQVDGRLISNGIVYLLNPAGVVFGQHSVVDVAHLIVAAAHLGDDDFLAGHDRFQSIRGKVEVLGHLSAKYVKLVGHQVENRGKIEAPRVIYSRGDHYYLGKEGEHLYVKCEKEALTDEGTFLACGSPESYFIHHAGTTKADLVEIDGGNADVYLSGNIDVSQRDTPGAGGSVIVQGRKIHQRQKSYIDATGLLGGGRVVLGGKESDSVDSDFSSTIVADALVKGDAGQIVLCGKTCKFNGLYSLMGGVEGGDAGILETAGNQVQGITTRYRMFAPNGKSGVWKIDSPSIQIVDTPHDSFVINSSCINNAPKGSTIAITAHNSIDLGTLFTPAHVTNRGVTLIFHTTQGTMTTHGSIHSGILVFDTPVTLLGSTNITVVDSINFTRDIQADTPQSLNLTAQGDIVLKGSLLTQGGGVNIQTVGDIHAAIINTTGIPILSPGRGSYGGDVTLIGKSIDLLGVYAGGTSAFPGSLFSGGRGGNVTLTTTAGLILRGSILATGGAGMGGGGQVLPTLIFPGQNLKVAGSDSPGDIQISGPLFLPSSDSALRGHHIRVGDVMGPQGLTLDGATDGTIHVGSLSNLTHFVIDYAHGVTVSGPAQVQNISLFNSGPGGITFQSAVTADKILSLANRFNLTFAQGYTAATVQLHNCQEPSLLPTLLAPLMEAATTLATSFTGTYSSSTVPTLDIPFDTSSSLFSLLRFVNTASTFAKVSNTFKMTSIMPPFMVQLPPSPLENLDKPTIAELFPPLKLFLDGE